MIPNRYKMAINDNGLKNKILFIPIVNNYLTDINETP